MSKFQSSRKGMKTKIEFKIVSIQGKEKSQMFFLFFCFFSVVQHFVKHRFLCQCFRCQGARKDAEFQSRLRVMDIDEAPDIQRSKLNDHANLPKSAKT